MHVTDLNYIIVHGSQLSTMLVYIFDSTFSALTLILIAIYPITVDLV